MTDQATSTDEGATGATVEASAAAGQGAATETVAAGAGADSVAASTGADTVDAGASTGLIRPEGLPDDLWDDAKGVKTGDLWAAYRDLKAEVDAAKADVPGETETYDLKLPEDFEVPEGLAVEIAADDPLWADFQSLGKKFGLNKAAFGEFVGAFAKYQIAAQQADVNGYVAEKTKLGANADTRINAADAWLKANLTSGQADALGAALTTAEGVQALEALIRLKSDATAASGVGAGKASKFDNTFGASRLDAIRASAAG
ncbi:MAG: hypothetical protein IOB84_13670 [Brevundimonas sp.]|nr:hypothetical protein [Brevundimonas sp.]